MKRAQLVILFCFAACISTSASAIFCPTSFNSVNLGDSITSVTQVCGPPMSQRTYKSKAPTAEEWNYYIRPLFSGQDMVSLKFIIKGDRVININITGNPDPSNGRLCNDAIKSNNQVAINAACNNPLWQRERNVSNTQLCGPAIISVGDPAQRVQMACGQAAFVKTYDQPDQNNNGGKEITEFTYNSNPPITFIFENGVLTDRQ